MRKIVLLLFCVFQAGIYAQMDTSHFAKIGFMDILQLSYFPSYYYDDYLQTRYSQILCDSSYYYPALQRLGLNYVVSVADSNTSLSSLYNKPDLTNNYPAIKIIDTRFRSCGYVYNGERWWHIPDYRLSNLAYSDGNYPGYLCYEAGGTQVGFDGSYEVNSFGFGLSNQHSFYLRPTVTLIGSQNRTDPNDYSIFVVCADTTTDNVGKLVHTSIPVLYSEGSSSHGGTNYTMMIRARIDPNTSLPGTDTVALIVFTLGAQGLPIRYNYKIEYGHSENQTYADTSYVAITANNFNTNQYTDIKVPIIRKENTGIISDVVWKKKRNLYIDNISVYSAGYDTLFVQPANVRADLESRICSQLTTGFARFSGMDLYSHLYHDEPFPLAARVIKKISDTAEYLLGAGRYIGGVNALGGFPKEGMRAANYLARPHYVMFENYPFKAYVDTTNVSSVQSVLDSVIYFSSIPWMNYGDSSHCGLRAAIAWAQNFTPAIVSDDVPLYHTMQVCSDREKLHPVLRAPTSSEILVQGWLAMCYGAKGLMYYAIMTNTQPSDADTNYSIYGLFESEGSVGAITQDPKLKQVTNTRYDAVKKLNGQIDKINSELMQLTWVDAFSAHKGIPTGKYVSNVHYPYNSGDTKYIEVGFFKKSTDMNNNNLEYLMVVNRRVLSSETRYITITLDKSTSPYNNWKISIVGENDPYAYTTKTGSFRYPFPPGEGRLFRIEPVLLAGGDLNYNDTLSASCTDNLGADITVQPGATLAVTSNATVHFPSSGSRLMVLGKMELNTNLTVPVNSILAFSSTDTTSPKLLIAPNKSITAQGIFCMNGSVNHRGVINRLGSSGAWGYITYDTSHFDPSAAYRNSFYYTDIKHGLGIKILYSGDMHIGYTNIDTCLHGIYIENTSPVIYETQIHPSSNAIYGYGLASPVIHDCYFFKENSYQGYHAGLGIYLIEQMCPYVYRNKITGFDYGMYFGGTNVVAHTTDIWDTYPNPNNLITGNNIGLEVSWGAYCYAGHLPVNGYNSIYSNSLDVKTQEHGTIMAQGNYWGTSGQPPTNYYCDTTSHFYSAGALSEDPWNPEQLIAARSPELSGIQAVKKISKDELLGNINKGENLEASGKSDEAIGHYKKMIADDIAGDYALRKIAILGQATRKEDTKLFLKDVLAAKGKYANQALSLMANMSLLDFNYTDAMALYERLISESPNSREAENARFDKLFAALHFEKNLAKAQLLLDELKQRKITDTDLLMRLSIAEDFVNYETNSGKLSKRQAANTETGETIKKYKLAQNYPNPFNPATSISYELPNDGYVSLVVYDVLGKVVKSLVDEQKQAGRYTSTFNASNLPSGIYFYTLKSSSFTSTKKMMLIK